MDPKFDFSAFSDAQIATAYDKAAAAGDWSNALMIKSEMDKRSAKPTAQTNMTEQAMSGLYEGLASGFGAPVDIVGAGLRKLGAPVPEDAFGGSESIKRGLGLLSGGQAIAEAGPQTQGQRIVRGAAESIGGSVPATLGMIGAGAQLATKGTGTAWDAFKSLLKSGAEEAKSAPAAYAATEAAISGSGGAARGAVETSFPDNPTAQTIAEFLGAIGGAAAVKTASRLASKATNAAMTPEDLKSTAGDMYNAIRTSNVVLPPSATGAIHQNVVNVLDDAGALHMVGNKVSVAQDYPKVSSAYELLKLYAGKDMDAKRVLTIRQSIANRMNDAEGTERRLLRLMLKQFDAETGNLSPDIKAANALYSRAMKAEQIGDMMDVARLNASRYSQSGIENAIRQEFRALAKAIVRGTETGWTPDEVTQINRIVEGGSMENIARFAGKFSPKGVVSAATSLGVPFSAAMKVTGDPYVSGAVAAGVGATGKAGELTAAALQKENVNALMQSILQGRNMTPAAQDKLRAALTAYLAGQAGQAGANFTAQ